MLKETHPAVALFDQIDGTVEPYVRRDVRVVQNIGWTFGDTREAGPELATPLDFVAAGKLSPEVA
ncbi:hypothetical protein [Amycolatopsis sp. cmx-11-51]|uniref:hypothetical protein n=1 Tax=unclassified Amycolatopsis TaxID=2618356 RepID=UPI0039E3A735